MKTFLLFCALAFVSVASIGQTVQTEKKGLTPEELDSAIVQYRNSLISPSYLIFQNAMTEYVAKFNRQPVPLQDVVSLTNWLKVNWRLTKFKSDLDGVQQWHEVNALLKPYMDENKEVFEKMGRATPEQIQQIIAPLLEREMKRAMELMEE